MIVASPRDNSQDSSVIFFISYCSRQFNNFDKFAINEIHLCCTDQVGASKCKSSGQKVGFIYPKLEKYKAELHTERNAHLHLKKSVQI